MLGQYNQIISISESFSHHNNAGSHSQSSNSYQIQTELLWSSLAKSTLCSKKVTPKFKSL